MNKNELEELWKADLKTIFKNPFCDLQGWQKKRLKLKFLNEKSKQTEVQTNPITFKITIPYCALDIDSDSRKVCLCHELGHIKHCLVFSSLYCTGMSLLIFGTICSQFEIALVGVFWLVVMWGYRYLYKPEEKEFEGDDMAVKLFEKGKVKIWLEKLKVRFSNDKTISESSKTLLDKRIERFK